MLRPGEVSLAHNGVLFLDEFSEFRRDAIEGLRQPIEDGRVVITRGSGAVCYPARFTLVAASNPCRCGFLGDQRRPCSCAPHQVQSYSQKMSGPPLDRIDIRLTVPRLTREELLSSSLGESSSAIRERVESTRERQRGRYASSEVSCNAQVPGPVARRDARLSAGAAELLAGAVDALGLTGRGFDRTLKVARTIADMEGVDEVDQDHIAEALSYRGGAQELAGV